MIAACPPLDGNSAYCNLLQCTDFADFCILAERDGQPVGWVSGYRPLSAQENFFVWQVAVAAEARGQGLAGRMIEALLARS
ncbi:MAG: diaminobutyrate acetyltransferase, partial [Sphingobium sp. 32-64-5]